MRFITASFRIALAALPILALTVPALAHPHVWVTMTSELVYAPDGSGNVIGIRHHWAFDDMFSAFATQGLDSKVKGQFTREELQPLAKTNIDSLKDYKYFNYATADGKKVQFTDPLPGYWLDYINSILVLNFALPFAHPVRAKSLKIEIYDPTIFVDFEFAKKTPVEMINAPKGCTLDVVRPKEITAAQSVQLGEAFFNSLTTAQNWGAQFANKILVNCP